MQKEEDLSPDADTFPYHPIHKYKDANHLIDELRENNKDAKKVLHTLQEGTSGTDANVVYYPQVFWLYSNSIKKLVLFDFARLNKSFYDLTGERLSKNNVTRKKKVQLSKENEDYIRRLYNPDVKLYDLVKNSNGIYHTDTHRVMKLGTPSKLITPIRMINKYDL